MNFERHRHLGHHIPLCETAPTNLPLSSVSVEFASVVSICLSLLGHAILSCLCILTMKWTNVSFPFLLSYEGEGNPTGLTGLTLLLFSCSHTLHPEEGGVRLV